mmetsp:Transcript_5184/g.18625  ORF Transcript_5184/g.18625 Transcript_5184/m.18625 type:complete len:228 (+) Transcript_5184:466-1149(+)
MPRQIGARELVALGKVKAVGPAQAKLRRRVHHLGSPLDDDRHLEHLVNPRAAYGHDVAIVVGSFFVLVQLSHLRPLGHQKVRVGAERAVWIRRLQLHNSLRLRQRWPACPTALRIKHDAGSSHAGWRVVNRVHIDGDGAFWASKCAREPSILDSRELIAILVSLRCVQEQAAGVRHDVARRLDGRQLRRVVNDGSVARLRVNLVLNGVQSALLRQHRNLHRVRLGHR